MSLNESIVEDAALEWFGELGYAVGHGPHLAPGEPAAERVGRGNIEHRTPNIERRSEEQRHMAWTVRRLLRITLFVAEPRMEVAE